MSGRLNFYLVKSIVAIRNDIDGIRLFLQATRHEMRNPRVIFNKQ